METKLSSRNKKKTNKNKDHLITDKLYQSDLLQDLFDLYVDSRMAKTHMRRVVEIFNRYSSREKKIPSLDTLIKRVHDVNTEYDKSFY